MTTKELLAISLPALKTRLQVEPHLATRRLLNALMADPRAGAQQLAHSLRTQQTAQRRERQRLTSLWQYEHEARAQGHQRIAGVDEAGIGPMAGPIVAGAVILPADYELPGLDDSKRLDETMRDALALVIKRDAIAWSVGIAEVEEIDRINVYHAGLAAMRRAVLALAQSPDAVLPDFVLPDFILVDARTIPDIATPQRGIIKGDQRSASIAAASIIAKTTRDALMLALDQQYPGYGLAAHKGYVTPAHCQALRERGVLPIHRRSFRPVREALGLEPVQAALFS